MIKPVRFRLKSTIHSSVGVPHHSYVKGVHETTDKAQIAVLRRLPNSVVEEITPESVSRERYVKWTWEEQRDALRKSGLYRVGMTREEVTDALVASDR